MYYQVLLFLVLASELIYRDSSAENLDDIVPDLLENDPVFQKLFPHIVPTINVGTRIVGGSEAVPHSHPYQVGMVTRRATGSFFCGGSLINARTILTAAHCVDNLTGNTSIYLGAHTITPPSEGTVILTTNDVVVHPQWNRSRLLNDIAILRLDQPVQLNERIKSILLPSNKNNDYLGSTCVVAGWGRTIETTASASPVLKELESYIISNDECRIAYRGYIQDSSICMATTIGQSTCNGDSGGPLVVDGVQVGVVSFGSGYGCSQGYPAAFARVSYFLDWINENLAPVPEST